MFCFHGILIYMHVSLQAVIHRQMYLHRLHHPTSTAAFFVYLTAGEQS